ncbi:phage integrase central domain-containing protein [Marinomonas sp. 2405UD68-3]|uniref:phage integrase central domain-containing protein n=1 Tax=Marinomonas sp. 2405UD68-3 TaxID=3391835 RepID=UPI0039C8ECFF
MDQLFHDWYRTDLSRRLKHSKIPYRVYTKDISPVIGIKCIAKVTTRDVREVLERIRESNCPTIANDTLMYMKQLFRHAIKLDLTLNNPAAAFTVDDDGGVESSKDRMLSKEEIHCAFSVFHTHINSFGRDNYCAKPLTGLTSCKFVLVARLMFSQPDEQAIVRIWDQIRLTAPFLNFLYPKPTSHQTTNRLIF